MSLPQRDVAWSETFGPTGSFHRDPRLKELTMGKGILLWLIGVPIPVILLLWLFFH
jgi:hypothetical protein